jgi:molybdopterin synthase catalytic subunit
MVAVRYFAGLREAIGIDGETVDVAPGTTVGALLDALAARHPRLGALRRHVRAAVNRELADDARTISEGDEVALLPPLAGGAGGLVELSESPLSVDRAIESVRAPGIGGIVVFLGLVRDSNDGHVVETLQYEAYAEMAIRELGAVAASVERDFPGSRVCAVHRTGLLRVGEVAVIVAAGAPHRDSAFAAARALIDRVKEQVPIWKRESGPGGVHWVGLPPPPK